MGLLVTNRRLAGVGYRVRESVDKRRVVNLEDNGRHYTAYVDGKLVYSGKSLLKAVKLVSAPPQAALDLALRRTARPLDGRGASRLVQDLWKIFDS